jgi:hypothetical protein
LAFIISTVYYLINVLGYELIMNRSISKTKENTEAKRSELIYRWIETIGATSLLSLFGSIIIYPADTVKRLMQTTGMVEYSRNFFSTNHAIFLMRKQGLSSFYK